MGDNSCRNSKKGPSESYDSNTILQWHGDKGKEIRDVMDSKGEEGDVFGGCMDPIERTEGDGGKQETTEVTVSSKNG
ncbi:hypothetical protein CDL15_Pgr020867 [Punica granatum]|uniref:Uncharacterized protein n=1 Tax=Punica granatum TaxID=22663 RepID=A0A218XVC2_PUNGR|nr:hypothetical protein CDL15_Pgr020867 [Punica granatum]